MGAQQLQLFPGLKKVSVPDLSRLDVDLLSMAELGLKIERKRWRTASLRRLVKLGLLRPLNDGHYKLALPGRIAVAAMRL